MLVSFQSTWLMNFELFGAFQEIYLSKKLDILLLAILLVDNITSILC